MIAPPKSSPQPQKRDPLDLPLALTMGDPAGVGGDITLKAWLGRDQGLAVFFTIDDPQRLKILAQKLGLDVPIKVISHPREASSHFATALPVLAHPLDDFPSRAAAVINAIERAVSLTLKGDAAAVVTNPIAKEALYDAGFAFPGHTEFLAHLATRHTGQAVTPVMMLAGKSLRVVLATVHVSVRDAVSQLKTQTIVDVARITAAALKHDFAIPQPTIAVAGLNPHAGEGGAMGREEIDIIAPAIAQLRADAINATGPHPPDTLFTAHALPRYDVALCMYHDQGLIPVKTLDFNGVNITLGLPFVRTSPDHGTAFDIAGTGRASELSLVAALQSAARMARARHTDRHHER